MSKTFKNIITFTLYMIALIVLFYICFKINDGIVMKGLFMDDLLDWSWYRGSSWYDFAIKFYSKNRYRPVFETTQYILYGLVGTDPTKFTFYNKIYNALIAFFIFHFVRKLDAGYVIALVTGAFYLVAHFAYYQIGQGIGTLESDALFLAIITIYFCLKLTGVIVDRKDGVDVKRSRHKNILYLICIFIFYFLLVFTHERYIGLLLPIFISILCMKKPENDLDLDSESVESKKRFLTFKIFSFIAFVIELLLIVILRYIAIGRVMPSGTGGTYVEETFKFEEFITYCFNQVAIIFGMNIGPEHLFGIDFSSITDTRIKKYTFLSIGVISYIIFVYIIKRLVMIKKTDKEKAISCLSADFIFLTTIMMCIASSSVTIRVEMRFVYVSFTLALIYLAYMCSYIISNTKIIFFKYIPIILFIAVFALRYPIEVLYRSYYDKIHCYVDVKRMNSLYDHTIGTYGLDEILHKKKVYIINQLFGMTNFYSDYYFKIYDINDIGKKINLVGAYEEIPVDEIDEDTIILTEDWVNNVYLLYENT